MCACVNANNVWIWSLTNGLRCGVDGMACDVRMGLFAVCWPYTDHVLTMCRPCADHALTMCCVQGLFAVFVEHSSAGSGNSTVLSMDSNRGVSGEQWFGPLTGSASGETSTTASGGWFAPSTGKFILFLYTFSITSGSITRE